ncbi:MAG: hypothetical protein ACLRMJ_07105 [Alistipes finegoldii]
MDVSFSELESIADAAGIAAEGTGDLYWAVEEQTAFVDGALLRPQTHGYPHEGYSDRRLHHGRRFGVRFRLSGPQALGAGKFEIFTKLTTDAAGYNFTDGDTADARKFVVEGGAVGRATQASFRPKRPSITSCSTSAQARRSSRRSRTCVTSRRTSRPSIPRSRSSCLIRATASGMPQVWCPT